MAAWTRRVIVGFVLLAMVVGITPPASAQEVVANPPGVASPVTPEIFAPGEINRSPQGEGAPAGELRPSGGQDASEPVEVVERRTADSRTFVREDGRFKTVFYGGPVHYRDNQGAWQPIDTALVPSAEAGVALRNSAGPVQVSLPAALGSGPVVAARDGISVAFTMRGATGAPSPGTPQSLPPASSEEAARSSATYANAVEGVDVSYSAMPEGVKEDVVLAGPDAPTSFDFVVETSPGLSARETPGGGIDFVDAEGNPQASFAPPFAYDANFKTTGAQSAYTEEAVSLRIVESAPELVVRLAVDPVWLAAPERAWPVVVDPVLTISSAGVDTFLSKSQPDTNYGGDSHLQIASATTGIRRPIYSAAIQDFFDEPAIVVDAELRLYADIVQITPVSPVAAHAVTQSWSSSQATWNRRLSGVAWNSPGGDFASEALSVVDNVANGPGWYGWDIAKSAQGWVDGEANLGVVLKHVSESSGAHIFFASANHSESSLRPRIVVTWQPLAGLRSPYAYEEFDLADAGTASINMASGNLTIADGDLSIAGTGLDASVARFYQSRIAGKGSVGPRWRMWPQSEERLYPRDNGDVAFAGGPEELVMFYKNANGTFRSPHGYRATLTYDSSAKVYRLSFHESGIVYTFTSPGYLRDIVDRNANKISFGYVYNSSADEYYIVSMTDTQGRVSTFDRAGEYKVTKITDPAGRTHTYAYDVLTTNLASYSDPAGKVTRYDYGTLDTGALVTRVTDPNGVATTFGYDSAGRLTRLTRVTDALLGTGPTWSFDYSTPWQTKVSDPKGNATVHHFDRRGRVFKVIDALGHERLASYDSSSNVIDRTSALGNKSIATFDPNSNLKTSTLPTGAKTSLEYTNTAFKYFPTKVTNPQGGSLSYGYDTKGNVSSVTDSMPTPGVSRFTYNANGTVATATDARGKVTTYGYDAKGNLTKVTPPAPLGATTIAYDGLSRPTTVTDGKGQVTTTTYDVMDRVTQTSVSGGPSVVLDYDDGGRLIERTDAAGITTYTYDARNQLTGESFPAGASNSYAYDSVGNLTSITDAGGTLSYAYNKVNLVTQLSEPGGNVTTFAYDNDDNRTATNYPNGVTQSVTYDTASRLKVIEGKRASTTLTRFAYTYTMAGTTTDTGLRRSVTDKDGNVTAYGYDGLDRLTSAVTKDALGSTTSTYTYDYDTVGNRISESVNGAAATSATFNDANQLTSRAGVTYSYDANGNQTGSSAGQALAYNTADQTTSLQSAGGAALPASYAGLNQVERRTAGATSFTNSLLGVTAETASATTKATTRDPAGGLVGLRSGADRFYYLFDGLGSVVALTNSTGAVTHSYTYDPYGVTTETTSSAVTNPWRYAGQYQDVSTGLYKMGARYYQPELGRWSQPDPSGAEANPYLYAASNPVNFVDPSGLLPSSNQIIDALQFAAGLATIAFPGLSVAVTAANVGIDVAQALFSDCPLRESIRALITGLLSAGTFGAIEAAGYQSIAAAASAITAYALNFLNYEC